MEQQFFLVIFVLAALTGLGCCLYGVFQCGMAAGYKAAHKEQKEKKP